nr:MAG TPA: major tail protein [Caudoviricetes sp.]
MDKLLKSLLHEVYASRSEKDDPLQGFKFRISIPGLPDSCGFSKISGLTMEIGVTEYDEGGYDVTHKLQGKAKGGELTCEKGAFPSTQVEQVFRKALSSKERSTIVVNLLDSRGKVQRTWKFAECWCSKWELGDLDASSEDVLMETLTLQYEYML